MSHAMRMSTKEADKDCYAGFERMAASKGSSSNCLVDMLDAIFARMEAVCRYHSFLGGHRTR